MMYLIRNSKGSVLVVALWAILFLSMTSIALAMRARSQAHILQRLTLDRMFTATAYSGIGYVQEVFNLLETQHNESKVEGESEESNDGVFGLSWNSIHLNQPEYFQNISLGEASSLFSIGYYTSIEDGRSMIYGLANEESKINLNYADDETLSRIYEEAGGLLSDQADRMALQTIQWRERDTEMKEFGQIVTQGSIGFGSLDELLVVPDMTYELWRSIYKYITVYGNGKVNLNTVSTQTLKVLMINDDLIERIDEYRQEVEAQQLSKGAQNIKPFTDLGDLTAKIGITSEEAEDLYNLSELWTFDAETFRFSTYMTGGNGRSKGFECVLNRGGQLLMLKETV